MTSVPTDVVIRHALTASARAAITWYDRGNETFDRVDQRRRLLKRNSTTIRCPSTRSGAAAFPQQRGAKVVRMQLGQGYFAEGRRFRLQMDEIPHSASRLRESARSR